MATAFKTLMLFFLSEECYEIFFNKLNFLHVPCLKAAISKALGIGIIAGSVMVKVPQIMKILNAKSAVGISIIGVLLELFAITATVAYSFVKGFPFSAWGEGSFLVIQTALIGALVLYFSEGGGSTPALSFLTLYTVILSMLVSGATPIRILWLLQAVNVPVVIAAKAVQANANYKNGHTGQLSAVTVFLLFFGSLARVFTSIQETGDSLIITTYIAGTIANGVIAGQVLYYREKTAALQRLSDTEEKKTL